jgi:hypothetical protein
VAKLWNQFDFICGGACSPQLKRQPLGNTTTILAYATDFTFDSVVVLESLPAGELRTGRDLFDTILAPFSLSDPGFVSELRTPDSAEAFLGHLNEVVALARKYRRSPIIHIEAHGDKDGIGFADESSLTWADLVGPLTTLNELSRMNLCVVAALCHGWHLSSVLRPVDRAPAFGVLGTMAEPCAGELLVSMQHFYTTLLAPGNDLNAALRAANANIADSDDHYRLEGAERMLCKVFDHYVRTAHADESLEARADRLLKEHAVNTPVPPALRAQLHAVIVGRLADNRGWFDRYRTRFLMLTEFPENEPRFSLRYEDCAGSANIDERRG